MKSLACGAALTAAFCCSAAQAGPRAAPPAPLAAPAWAIAPADTACRTDIELTGRSGATVDVALESDGERVLLRFARGQIPERAFLPIRVDAKPFANLVQATEDPATAAMTLSDETLAAMRRGGVLQVAWLGQEAVKSSLAGAAQGLSDLRTCGAQVAAQARARASQAAFNQAQAEAQAHAKAVADEQLAAARAQTAAAQAEQRRLTAEADRAAAEADRQRALAQADRQRAQAVADGQARQQAAVDDDDYYPQRYPQPAQAAPWGYYYSPYDRR